MYLFFNAHSISRLVISSDGTKFTVSRQIAEMSQTIKNLLDGFYSLFFFHSSNFQKKKALPDLDEEIPLSNLTGEIFQKVLDFCVHHKVGKKKVN